MENFEQRQKDFNNIGWELKDITSSASSFCLAAKHKKTRKIKYLTQSASGEYVFIEGDGVGDTVSVNNLEAAIARFYFACKMVDSEEPVEEIQPGPIHSAVAFLRSLPREVVKKAFDQLKKEGKHPDIKFEHIEKVLDSPMNYYPVGQLLGMLQAIKEHQENNTPLPDPIGLAQKFDLKEIEAFLLGTMMKAILSDEGKVCVVYNPKDDSFRAFRKFSNGIFEVDPQTGENIDHKEDGFSKEWLLKDVCDN